MTEFIQRFEIPWCMSEQCTLRGRPIENGGSSVKHVLPTSPPSRIALNFPSRHDISVTRFRPIHNTTVLADRLRAAQGYWSRKRTTLFPGRVVSLSEAPNHNVREFD